jgi:hypothetical protein
MVATLQPCLWLLNSTHKITKQNDKVVRSPPWLTATEYLCHKSTRIYSVGSHHNAVLSSFITYHWVCNKNTTTGVTSGTRVTQCLATSGCVVVCRSLFVPHKKQTEVVVCRSLFVPHKKPCVYCWEVIYPIYFFILMLLWTLVNV